LEAFGRVEAAFANAGIANVKPPIPMRRFGESSDFGAIAVYLLSGLSSYHTGDCLIIDGGYCLF
jgi:NAD(P)-dependent dehydrogenase (short-subunit alcohol dehydrogenase family)